MEEHAGELRELAERRRAAAEAHRDEVIRRNIRELLDLLVADPDLLPCEAAERLSVRRIAIRESDRTAADIMEPIPTIPLHSTVRQAAVSLVEAGCPILAIVSPTGELSGVVTEWDITRATALGSPDDLPLEQVMTRQVVSASPHDGILEVIRQLEYHEISQPCLSSPIKRCWGWSAPICLPGNPCFACSSRKAGEDLV